MSYEEVRDKLAERFGISPTDVDDWTLDQVESSWRGGRRPKGIVVRSAADVAEAGRHISP